MTRGQTHGAMTDVDVWEISVPLLRGGVGVIGARGERRRLQLVDDPTAIEREQRLVRVYHH